MKTKQKIFIQVLIALTMLVCIKSNTIYANNLSGNQIFKINSKTITSATNVDQLKNMFGDPKITKDSPFGGKAYIALSSPNLISFSNLCSEVKLI